MLRHFRMLADYNRWANTLVYAAARSLTEREYRENKGAFFGSLHQTLNHLLVTDRMWLRRFTGTGDDPRVLDAILFEHLPELTEARRAEDQRIMDWIGTLDDAALACPITYTAVTRPGEISHPLEPALAHLFNHQTHHRGQCHMTLTALGKPSIGLDLMQFLRDEGRQWM